MVPKTEVSSCEETKTCFSSIRLVSVMFSVTQNRPGSDQVGFLLLVVKLLMEQNSDDGSVLLQVCAPTSRTVCLIPLVGTSWSLDVEPNFMFMTVSLDSVRSQI